MDVDLLDHMGSDLDVVNAARVSFAKESKWDEEWRDEDGGYYQDVLPDKDAKLIHYLAKHHHWTPFSHCYAKFRIKAPLFVRSQLFKHKVGLTENEVSRRYVDTEPEFYVPDVWRRRAEDKKQGSSDTPVDLGPMLEMEFDNGVVLLPVELYEHSLATYNSMLKLGVCPEQARMVLPQSMYTEWIWSGSLAAFARIYAQRTSDHAQQETRWVALAIGDALEPLFPVSWKALTNA